jgi:AcrR family transcriptional regulator
VPRVAAKQHRKRAAQLRKAGRAASGLPRDESKQQTREALVAAALELFAEDGLDASLDAICERAGYTRGAFYVHFPDRDALLVAVMEKVGERFLSAVFEGPVGDGAKPHEEPDEPLAKSESLPTSILAGVVGRFISAIDAGRYPLMASKEPSGVAPPKPQVRPHQLLDACARSPVVQERYRALVKASIDQIAHLALADQAAGAVVPDLEARQLGTLLLCAVLGAQTMAELGVDIDRQALGRTVTRMMTRR